MTLDFEVSLKGKTFGVDIKTNRGHKSFFSWYNTDIITHLRVWIISIRRWKRDTTWGGIRRAT